MELIKPNFINTTTMIVVNTNTSTAENIMIPDTSYQFYSSSFNDDNTTVTLRINFGSTTTIDRIAILGHNLREFIAYYNGATASTFSLSNGPTTASTWSSNSETAQYLTFTPIACTSVTLDMKKTMVANAEKAIGYLVISQSRYDFARIPAAKGYRPVLTAQEVEHMLSTGDMRVQNLANKWNFEVELNYITESQRNSLKTIYDLHDSHIFVPFGTATSWDQVIAPVVWPAPFEFFKFSDNAPSTGFEGMIRLHETTP